MVPQSNYRRLLEVLKQADVEFIIIGGVAGILHGSARFTQDVDVLYARDESNIRRIERALAPHRPYLRGAPPGLPFKFDYGTIKRGLNFTLTTDLGSLDRLAEIVGGGTYENLRSSSEALLLYGREYFVLKLEALIETKKAAGRPKDLEAIAELHALLDAQNDQTRS